jgi:hypothetical protein
MRAIVLLLIVVAIARADAAIMPESERDELIALVLKNFWGRAKLSKGELAQPASEAERNTVPIAKPVAYRALEAGEISGLAEWCRLDWESHYLSITKAARARGYTDKQVAFVSFLHGAAQGRVADAMAKSGMCGEQGRLKVQDLLNRSLLRGLEGS